MSKRQKKCAECVPDINELLPIREYHCEYNCLKVFKNRVPYEEHLKRKHDVVIQKHVHNSFKCPVPDCEYIGGRLPLLRRHYQMHHMETKHTCTECGRKFLLELQLLKHRCHNLIYPCQTCPRVFKLLSMRNRHVIRCSKKRVHEPNPTNNKHEVLNNDQKHITLLDPADFIIKVKDSKSKDDIFVEEFQQLLINIENKTVKDPALIKELAALIPILLRLQSKTC